MKVIKLLCGCESLQEFTQKYLHIDEESARGFVMKYFNDQLVDKFSEIHLKDVASLVVALEGISESMMNVLEQHPEEKEAYLRMKKKVSVTTVYAKGEQEGKEDGSED